LAHLRPEEPQVLLTPHRARLALLGARLELRDLLERLTVLGLETPVVLLGRARALLGRDQGIVGSGGLGLRRGQGLLQVRGETRRFGRRWFPGLRRLVRRRFLARPG